MHACSYPPTVDIGIAVSLPGGLVTPVLSDVSSRNIFELAAAWKKQLAAAKAKDFAAASLNGATFYISNLGSCDIDFFDSILPKDCGCIMAVGAVRKELVPAAAAAPAAAAGAAAAAAAAANNIQTRRVFNVSLTCDHRHIYGQHAADFLKVRKYKFIYLFILYFYLNLLCFVVVVVLCFTYLYYTLLYSVFICLFI